MALYGEVILIGDFNARTCDLDDFIKNDNINHIQNTADTSWYVTDNETIGRTNQDLKINKFGRKLISMCKSLQLRILNGRKLGDFDGKFTCFKPNGKSVVDYAIVSQSHYSNIVYFEVSPPNQLSDYALISLSIKIKTLLKHDTNSEHINGFTQSVEQIHWNDKVKKQFIHIINDPLSITSLEEISSIKDVDEGCRRFNDYMLNMYRKIKPFTKLKLKKCTNQRTHKKWFDKSCKELKNKVLGLGKLVQKYQSDPIIYGNFISAKKDYKRLIKKKERNYKNTILQSLTNLHSSNPKEYWNLVKLIRKSKHEHACSVELHTWVEHFKSLYSVPNQLRYNKQLDSAIQIALKNYIQNNKANICFDTEISYYEDVKAAINKQKNGKAFGNDYIINEMLKSGVLVLNSHLTKLFNNILASGEYPLTWAGSWITPIHRKGDLVDPNNYRAISITSCLSKVFTSMINNRLNDFCENNKVLPKEQIGFSKGFSTSDHIFVLKTIIDDMKKNQGKPLYCAFIDLSKAFDSVWHLGLYYKLIQLNIGSRFIQLLQNMYGHMYAQVKQKHKLSQKFGISIGTR